MMTKTYPEQYENELVGIKTDDGEEMNVLVSVYDSIDARLEGVNMDTMQDCTIYPENVMGVLPRVQSFKQLHRGAAVRAFYHGCRRFKADFYDATIVDMFKGCRHDTVDDILFLVNFGRHNHIVVTKVKGYKKRKQEIDISPSTTNKKPKHRSPSKGDSATFPKPRGRVPSDVHGNKKTWNTQSGEWEEDVQVVETEDVAEPTVECMEKKETGGEWEDHSVEDVQVSVVETEDVANNTPTVECTEKKETGFYYSVDGREEEVMDVSELAQSKNRANGTC